MSKEITFSTQRYYIEPMFGLVAVMVMVHGGLLATVLAGLCLSTLHTARLDFVANCQSSFDSIGVFLCITLSRLSALSTIMLFVVVNRFKFLVREVRFGYDGFRHDFFLCKKLCLELLAGLHPAGGSFHFGSSYQLFSNNQQHIFRRSTRCLRRKSSKWLCWA